MATRSPVHIAEKAARLSGVRIGKKTRCGLPLEQVAFYFDEPFAEDLIDETCRECLAHAREERRNATKKTALARRARPTDRTPETGA